MTNMNLYVQNLAINSTLDPSTIIFKGPDSSPTKFDKSDVFDVDKAS